MGSTEEANRSEIVVPGRARRKEEVLSEATAFVRQNGGDPGDQFLVLAHCKIQFGKHQGQRFWWLLENSLGYAVYLVSSIMGEEERDNPLSASKHLFLRYTSQIREIGEAVEVYQKKQAMLQEAQRTGDSGCLMVEFGDFKGRSMKEVYEDRSKEAQAIITYPKKAKARPKTNMALFKTYVLKRQASAPAHLPTVTVSAPSTAVPTATVTAPPAATQSRPLTAASVKTLLARGKHLSPSQLAQKIMLPAKPYTAAGEFFEEEDDQEMVTVASQAEEQLPQGIRCCLKEALLLTLLLQRCGLPVPCSSHLQSFLHTGRSNSHPSSRTGSGRPACNNHRLTDAGCYRTVRKVLDIDGWYDMATEYLECKGCEKKYPAWYSCDYCVVIMMRERTHGNSVTQLYKKLQEEHSAAWTRRALEYFTDSSIIEPLSKPKWLLSVYTRDVLSRLPEVRAKITSVFGSVLKMNSTKKVTKKLAGAAANTAGWCTNVGNEHGQVLVSMLTAAEGHGLWPMAAVAGQGPVCTSCGALQQELSRRLISSTASSWLDSPGTSASDHFQAYLLEGLMRWNQDRMEEAVRGNSELRAYSSAEREAMDRLSRKILRMPLDERYQPPGANT
ncbi:hypothetical protein CHARACLAT_027900, partial [Characodon lateralis]|nr:hypothetical protein [Characodon lateralis]